MHNKTILLLSCYIVIQLKGAIINAQWMQTNGPYGTVAVTAIATAFDGTMYAGVESAGVYKSTNGGEHWTPTSLHPSLKHTESILVTPNGYVFANNGRQQFNGGVTRSTDGGISWTSALQFGQYSVAAMAVTPNGNIFVAGHSSGVGLFRSTDYGNSWTELLSNADFVTADRSGNIYVARSDSTVLRSTNEGETWSISANGLRNKGVYSVQAILQTSILAIATDRTSFADSLFLSTDRGATWTSRGPKTPYGLDYFCSDPQGGFIFRTGYYEIRRATDFGSTWTTIYNNPSTNHRLTLAFDTLRHLFAATNYGIIRSSTWGDTWDTLSHGFKAPLVTSLLNTSHGLTLAGTYGHGAFRSTNGGNIWLPMSDAGGQFGEHPNGNLFCTNVGLRRSTDGGIVWTLRHVNTEPNGSSFPNNISIDSNGVIIAGGGFTPDYAHNYPRVWKTSDEGSTWSILYSTSTEGSLTSLITTPGGLIIAGLRSGTIMRSTDGGATWLTNAAGLPTDDYAVVLLSTLSGHIFAGTAAHGLFRSSDNGAHWQPSSSGLTDISIKTIVVNRIGHLFVGTNSAGVFRSTDGGNGWFSVNSNLTDLSVLSLSLDTSGCLFAGTGSSGVCRTTSSTTSVEKPGEIPSAFWLDQNYPNPFNPTTTISFQIPNHKPQTLVSLKVFDLLGREVATLVNEEVKPGSYERVFNAEGLASGVYLYRLQAGNFVQTKRLVLVR